KIRELLVVLDHQDLHGSSTLRILHLVFMRRHPRLANVSHRMRFLTAAIPSAIWLALTMVHGTASADEFAPSATLDLPALERQVVQRSPAIQQDLLEHDLARAEARQARIIGNPTLDGTWGTIPIGETNPAGLDKPLANVPNYGVGLSYTVPLGKR